MNAETMTDKPAPCPKCQAVNERTIIEGPPWFMQCGECGFRTVDCSTEAEALTAWNARTVQAELVEALKWYADQFCEFGQPNEGCGKYHDDVCAGCKARSAITRARPDHALSGGVHKASSNTGPAACAGVRVRWRAAS